MNNLIYSTPGATVTYRNFQGGLTTVTGMAYIYVGWVWVGGAARGDRTWIPSDQVFTVDEL